MKRLYPAEEAAVFCYIRDSTCHMCNEVVSWLIARDSLAPPICGECAHQIYRALSNKLVDEFPDQVSTPAIRKKRVEGLIEEPFV